MDQLSTRKNRRSLAVGMGVVAAVTTVLLTNSSPAVPTTDIAATWTGTVSLLVLTLKTINARLKVLESRLYELGREVSELEGRTQRKR